MRRRVKTLLCTAALLAALAGAHDGIEAQAPPATVVDRAVAAMGGEARLRSIKSLKLSMIGHRFALEQSERPEGPWLVTYRERNELRDLSNDRLLYESRSRFWSMPEWSTPSTTVVSGGTAARTNGQRWTPGAPVDVKDAQDVFALAPERVLFTARHAPDLRSAPGTTLHGVPQDVLAFTWNGKRLRLHLSRDTHLPTMLLIERADDTFGIWGDVVERRWFSFWTLEAGGLMYPRQTTVDFNGQPDTDTTILALEVDVPIDDARFAIPEETQKAYAAFAARPFGLSGLRLDPSRVAEVVPGIVQFAGSWHVLVVRQPDGLVIVESPISSRYSREVLDAARAKFPEATVKALVTTSDAWPHFGGLREYVADGVPVHALDLNVPILRRLLDSTRSTTPDSLSAKPRPAVIHPVDRRMTIGSGETRMDLIPVRGEFGERMMLAWFPQHRLLYASDMIQRGREKGSFFMPSMLAEVEAVVRREGLDPERVVAMHLEPTPWSAVTDALAAIRAGGSEVR